MTVTELARTCGVSRGTILHYESLGLLTRPRRTGANYRVYDQADVDRLRRICIYRNAGLKLDDIRTVVDQSPGNAAGVLQRRLVEIDAEIATLRAHQQQILRLLAGKNSFRRNRSVTKEKWTEIMRNTGFSDDDMRRWHVEFERAAPVDHQQFLEYLHIPADEIKSIRKWSSQS